MNSLSEPEFLEFWAEFENLKRHVKFSFFPPNSKLSTLVTLPCNLYPILPMKTEREPLSPDRQNELLAAAKLACEHAYAPYSNFRVGAAVMLESGEVFSGCNVENASYGLTNCAERTAIFSAIAARGGRQVRIRAVAVVNDRGVACSPCGACRQVISEFGPDAEIFYLGPQGIQSSSMRQLLPHSFTSESLT